MKKRGFLSLLLLLLLIYAGSLKAQINTGTISGTVTDESGAVLPGVEVILTNLDTGRARTVITGDQGRYIAPDLPLGPYEVQASLPGFQTTVRQGIQLTVGRQVVVDMTLRIGEIAERVTVTGEAPLVETTQAVLADLVEGQKIRDLPLNGRSFTDLALLQAGVMTRRSTSSSFTAISGGGTRTAIGGARPRQNMYVLDGQEAKDAFGNTPGSAAGTTLGVETVREFSILSNTYSAEFGGAGGVINAVTKSGTNTLHGSVFAFHRNDNLDATNFFINSSGQERPEFKRNQFGFTLGGPIAQDQTFFFGSYEGLRERLGVSGVAAVPTAEVRNGILPGGRVVNVHPAVKPYLGLYPLPNLAGRENLGDGTGEFAWGAREPTDENYYLASVDHNFSESDLITIRWTYDKATNTRINNQPPYSLGAETRRQLVNISERRVISPTLINTARVSFNRSFGILGNLDPGIGSQFNWMPGQSMGQLQVGGLTSIGANAVWDRESTRNLFEYGDVLTYSVNPHSLKFGATLQRFHLNGLSGSRMHGRYVFSGRALENLLTNRPNRFEFLIPGTGLMRGFRQWAWQLFVQDDFHVRPNLTLNLGLRYEYLTSPTEVAGRISNVRDEVNDPEVTIGDPFFMTSKTNFAPRFGIAWDPFGTGKTSIRSGFGVFFQARDPATWWTGAYQNPPFFIRTVQRPTQFPNGLDLFEMQPELPVPTASPAQFQAGGPYIMQWHLSVQSELAPNTVLTLSYAGNRGVKIGRIKNANTNRFEVCPCADDPATSFDESTAPAGTKFWPRNSTRINPNFADIEIRAYDTNTYYHAFQTRLGKRFSGGFQAQLSYTFSKTLDMASGTSGGDASGAGAAPQDPFDQHRSKGLSGFHVQNQFTANFSLDLPSGDLAGLAMALLGGWQINGIVSVADGNPQNIILSGSLDRARVGLARGVDQGPSLAPGADNNPVIGDGRDPLRYWNPASFFLQPEGFLGDLGRNTGIGPGYANFDFSVVKNFILREETNLQFRAEFFNILNRANFTNPNSTIFSSSRGTPSGSFGRISNTSTPNRQIQLGLKLLF